ncbi:MAG: transglycosylase SLT domain-containing protein [Armatimonadota bacterium]
MRRYLGIAGVVLALVLLAALAGWRWLGGPTPTVFAEAPWSRPVERDLPQIREGKVLRVLAPYNSTSYFIYRGEPMGFEYELLRKFAKDHDLELRMVVVPDGEGLARRLRRGDGDVIAARLNPIPGEEAERQGIAFTHALYRTAPTVVQQEPVPLGTVLPEPVERTLEQGPGAEMLDRTRLDARLITRPAQLAGKQVHLPRGHPYQKTLIEIEDEISGDIHVVEVRGDSGIEGLIDRVAKGEISLTVAPKNVALLKESVYSNIEVLPTLSQPQKVSWAVRANAPELREALNAWIDEQRQGELLGQLYRKYFVDRRGYKERVESEYLTSSTGRLSPFDALLRQHAPAIGWDWRLLASLAYQESRFKPAVRSWAGAAGLLQLMPATAREFGCRDRNDPVQNVQGGVRFLQWLQEFWENRIHDEEERLKFIIASYNAGPGHVEDARRLTKKYGDDPDRWADVAYWMLQLSQKKYYADPVVRHGYVRGLEPVTYVAQILDRFEHYRQFVVTEA